MKTAVLLLNIGTPKSTQTSDVASYLRKFLGDGYVINLPWVLRKLLVNFLIAPLRAKRSAKAYKSIWSKNGSPLAVYSFKLQQKLQDNLGDSYEVMTVMNYSKPDIDDAIAKIKQHGFTKIIAIPMYPQYSAAATGASINTIIKGLQNSINFPDIHIIKDFYSNEGFIKAQAQLVKTELAKSPNSHVLFSYHGLPVKQVLKSSKLCKDCDINSCPRVSVANNFCYKAQCFETSRMLADKLQLENANYSTSFQSRLGLLPWIQPYTDKIIHKLRSKGVENLVVACPSFTIDCLETLEEIAIGLKESWRSIGGKNFLLVPCVNDSEDFVTALKEIVVKHI